MPMTANMKPNFGSPSSLSASFIGSICQAKAPSIRPIGMAMKPSRTAAIHSSTIGARMSAATKPRTTVGSDSIVSITGLTVARTRRWTNSEV
jgi:hypothetical protein